MEYGNVQKEQEIESLINDVTGNIVKHNNEQSIVYKISYYWGLINDWYIEIRKKIPLLFYSIKRLFFALITLYAATIVVYLLVSAVVTDLTYIQDISSQLAKLGWLPGSEQYDRIVASRKKMLGVDGPMIQQIFIYLRNITPIIPKTVYINPNLLEDGTIHTETVTKMFYLGLTLTKIGGLPARSEVTEVFKLGMPISFLLGTIGTLLSYLIGIPLGIYSAIKKDKPQDASINFISLVLIALPALVIIRLFFQFSLILGAGTSWNSNVSYTKIFPVLALVIFTAPGIVVSTRRFVVDEMTSDYKKFAASKGLSEKYIFFIHVFRNSFIRMVRNIPGVLVGSIFGASLLIERTWNISGMSVLMISGMNSNDLFIIMGIVVTSAFTGIVTALLGDLLLAFLDPRIKFS